MNLRFVDDPRNDQRSPARPDADKPKPNDNAGSRSGAGADELICSWHWVLKHDTLRKGIFLCTTIKVRRQS